MIYIYSVPAGAYFQPSSHRKAIYLQCPELWLAHLRILTCRNTTVGLKKNNYLKNGGMNAAIKVGDRVRHKNRSINGGLDMPVEEISKTQALCIYLDLKDSKYKEGWFNLRDVELTNQVKADRA